MKRLIIIVEGSTEQAFCESVLQPFFNKKEIDVRPSKIKKSKGGIVHWFSIKKQIENHLKQDTKVFVTLMIDFYGIHDKHEFPGWQKSRLIADKYKRIKFIEDAMHNDISGDLSRRFIPYIQLHEFEGLLFSDLNIYKEGFDDDEFLDYDYLVETVNEFDNPEMINDGKDTAPSKRLENKIFKRYDKVVYGSLIAELIGLDKIRTKCSGFDVWIKKLSEI
jgi:hypothetical protein